MTQDGREPRTRTGRRRFRGDGRVIALPGLVAPGAHREARLLARDDARACEGVHVQGVRGRLTARAPAHAQRLEEHLDVAALVGAANKIGCRNWPSQGRKDSGLPL